MNKKLCQHATKDEVVEIFIDELRHPLQIIKTLIRCPFIFLLVNCKLTVGHSSIVNMMLSTRIECEALAENRKSVKKMSQCDIFSSSCR